MSVIQNNLLMTPEGYQISRSVRLRSSASAYLNRTPASAGNRTTWTWSGWIKRGKLASGEQMFFACNAAGNDNQYTVCEFTAADTLAIGGWTTNWRISSAVYRDPSAWYHVVIAVDTTQATANNRIRVYVNGVEVTSFGTLNNPTQNSSLGINQAANHTIGYPQAGSQYFDGYLTETNFVNALQLDATYFGETNPVTGVWQPKKYAGTYGTNGFYLNFSDPSAATAAAIGKDYSGNGNNWTPNNISVTAGVTYDSMTDVPTMWADGGNGRGNYAVINPLDKYSNVTVSAGNLDSTFSSYVGFVRASFALPSTGKWYWEGTVPTTDVRAEFGIATLTQSLGVDPQGASGCWFWYSNGTNSFKYNAGTGTSWGTAWSSGDIIGIAFDADAGTLTYYKNGSLMGGGAASTGLTGTYAPMVGFGNTTSTAISTNFGQRPFAYTPPTGFKALNTQNLPDGTIKKGNKYFDVVTRNGFGASGGSVATLNFQPDLFWEKQRNGVSNNYLIDSVRGVSKYLYSDATSAEGTLATYVTSFNSNGYTMGSSDLATSATMVDWVWKANGSAVSNTAGSITSQVNAGVSQGFSVVTYTGTGANATVGHGLGVAPKMIIIKSRSNTSDWIVYHASLPSAVYRLFLNVTNAQDSSPTTWNSTAPTSTVFSLGTNANVNSSTWTQVAYCFAEVAGFSKFGSYVGNGSADGPFVFTNFKPRFVMIKRTDSTSDWYMWDTARDTYDVMSATLLADTSGAEASAASIDALSNGFKCRSSTVVNASGGTYVYAAFATNPFKNSLAQ